MSVTSSETHRRPTPPVREQAYVLGGLYLAGTTLVLLALAFPFYEDADRISMLALTIPGYVGGAGLVLLGRRRTAPQWCFPVVVALASVLIAVSAVVAGARGSALMGTFYVFAAGYSFYYFPVRVAVAEVVLIATSYAVALAVVDTMAPVGQWIIIVGSSVIAGCVIGGLGARADRRWRSERATTSELREADEMKTAFLRAVSHDIRSPLAALAGYVDILRSRRDRLTPEQEERFLGRMHVNAERLQNIVDDLLQLDRLSAGRVEPDLEPTDLGELVTRTVEAIGVDNGRIRIRREEVVVPADTAKIQRALDNLIVNAVKYTPHDAPIVVGIEPMGDGGVVIVEDRGPGIPDHLKEVVFEPFVRGEGVDDVSGTGVGLSLVAQFARLHGGRVWVEDRPGGGARFCLHLPGGGSNGHAGTDRRAR